MSTMKIYCLFSIDNEYNQPDYNLVAFWFSKPTEEQLSEVISKDGAKQMLSGDYSFYRSSDHTEYRLREIPEGRVPPNE